MVHPLATEERIHARFGMTRAELTGLINQHTLSVQAWLSSRSPHARTFQGKGIRASSTGYKIPLLNLALGFSFPEGYAEAEIEKEIEEVRALFASREMPWYWWMTASPSPGNVRELLQKHGMQFDENPPLPAMAASLKELPAVPPQRDDIHIWQAQSIQDLQHASFIRRTAFKFREGEALDYFEAMPSDWLENPNVRLYLAGEQKDAPASIGALIVAEGIPGVYVMATLPDQHRKGFGKVILNRLMKDAHQAGHSILALTASRAGYGLYSQFGFEHIFGFDFYIPQG